MTRRYDLQHARRALLRCALVAAVVFAAGFVGGSRVAEAAPTPDTIIYGANGYGRAEVVEINLTQKTFDFVGDVVRETQAIDQDPATGMIYFYEWRHTGDEFGYFDPQTGGSVIVRQYSPAPGLYAKRMAFGPDGVLYMMDDNDVLYTIDKGTGDLTSLGAVSGLVNGQWGGTGDMAFAPDGTLYVATYRNLYTVDVGALTSTLLYSNMIPVTGVGITLWTGLAFCDGVLYASNAEQNTELSAIFSIDPATGAEQLEFYTSFVFNDLSSCSAVPVVNDPPVAVDGSLSTDEDVSVGVVLSASDPDGDALSFEVVEGPSNGVLSGTAPDLVYTPDADFAGSDVFTFVANDGVVDSNVATVSIAVTGVNDAPVAADGSLSTDEEVAAAVVLSGSDVDGDALSYAVVDGPENGVLSGAAPDLTYTPDAGYVGSDVFTFVANDGVVDSNVATVSITVTEVNDPPVAVDGSLSADEDVSVGVVLSASDPDGDALSFEVVEGPSNGVLSGTAPDLVYTPDADFAGSDVFTFVANDGVVDSNVATVSIAVTGVNDAPVAADGSLSTDEEVAAAVVLSGSDVDGDALSYAVVEGPSNGVLSGAAPDLTYTPDAGYVGSDVFTFVANDGVVDSNVATVSITVTEVNDPPGIATALDATVGDGQVSLTWNAPADDGGSAISDYVVQYLPVGGQWATFSDGTSASTSATVTALTNYDSYSFRVAAVNATGTGDDSATVAATPTDGDDPDDTFNHADGPLSGRAQWTRTDPANLSDLILVDGHVEGTSDPDGTGATYTTAVGPDVEVTIDALLGDSYNEASVVLRMRSLANYERSYLLQWVTDGDEARQGSIVGPGLQIWRIDLGPRFTLLAESSLPDNGERTLTFGASGSSLYIAEGETVHLSHTDSTYSTGDYFALGQANLSGGGTPSQLDNMRWTSLNDPNVAPGAIGGSVTTVEDVPVPVTLAGSDVDGDALTYRVTGGPASGSLSGTAPDLIYTPGPDFVGSDGFTFVANDGLVDSDPAIVSITVTGVNDAPVAAAGSAMAQQGGSVPVVLSGSDVDGDALTYRVVDGPSNGVLSGTAPDLTYTPGAGYVGPDAFTFVANDGVVDSNVATVSITVTEVNDAPVADDGSATTDEDVSVGVMLSGSDVDGDALTYRVVDGPSNGSLSGTAPDLVYTPDADFAGSDAFTFVANDGLVDSGVATVSLAVTGVNDAPVAADGSLSTDEDAAAAVALSASDVDGDALSYAVVDGPSNGSLSGTAPDLTYTPDPGYVGSDVFTFVANDGLVDSNVATVSITVTEVAVDVITWAPSRTGAMRTVDLTQGTSAAAPGLSFGTHAMDRDPVSGLLYYFEWNTTGRRFAVWNPATGSNTTIRTYAPAPGFFVTQMGFAPDGTLYMIDATAQLRTIDPATGAITTLGPISGMTNGLYGQMGDLAFAPDGTAYVASYDNLYQVDIGTRTATLLHGNMFGSAPQLWLGLAYCDGTLYGSNIDGPTNRSSIYSIDRASGAKTLVHALPTYVTDLTGCTES